MSAEVTAESVDIAAADGTADAIFVRPASNGPHPGVLLYMDAYGIRPALEAHAARLAAGGYGVLVPNLFYRNGRSPVLEDLEQLMQSEDRSALFGQLRPKIEALTPEAANADANAWLGFLRGQADHPLPYEQSRLSMVLTFALLESIQTARSARTIAADQKAHKLYLPAAEIGPAPTPGPDGKQGRPQSVPDSFHIIVVGR